MMRSQTNDVNVFYLDKTQRGDACSKLRSIQECMMSWDPRTRCCSDQSLCLLRRVGIALSALELIKTHAQINKEWVDTTEQEVADTINQPSIHSNLKRKVEQFKTECNTEDDLHADDGE